MPILEAIPTLEVSSAVILWLAVIVSVIIAIVVSGNVQWKIILKLWLFIGSIERKNGFSHCRGV